MALPKFNDIHPEYRDLVKYSDLDEPPLKLKDAPNANESIYPDDEPTRPVDLEENMKWAKELREALVTQ